MATGDIPKDYKAEWSMTKPTQAQIEAAAKVLNGSYENIAYSRKIAEAALTAAAEVGPMKEIKQYETMIERNRAAAEVGPDPDVVLEGTREGFDLFRKSERNATIERCAQTLDEKARHAKQDGLLDFAIAYENGAIAIRALKEKP